jgi:hypothetical protein
MAALALTGALVTAACGGGGSSGQKVVGGTPADAKAALTAAAQKTAAADSAKVTMTFGAKGSGLPDSSSLTFEVSGSGVLGFVSKSGELTLDLSGVPKDTKTTQVVPSSVHVVVVDGVGYMEIPPEFVSRAPAGKKWARLSGKDGAGALALAGGGGLSGLPDFTDPSKALAALQSLGDTTAVGTEKVRGVETTHYRTLVGLDKAFANSGSGTGTTTTSDVPNPFASVFANLKVPVDAWVGGDGLLRKMDMQVDLGSILGPLIGAFAGAFGASTSTTGAPFELKLSISVELYDYGTKVDVAAPPADQVVDASAIEGLTGG